MVTGTCRDDEFVARPGRSFVFTVWFKYDEPYDLTYGEPPSHFYYIHPDGDMTLEQVVSMARSEAEGCAQRANKKLLSFSIEELSYGECPIGKEI